MGAVLEEICVELARAVDHSVLAERFGWLDACRVVCADEEAQEERAGVPEPAAHRSNTQQVSTGARAHKRPEEEECSVEASATRA